MSSQNRSSCEEKALTADQDRVPKSEKLAYAVGAIADNSCGNTVKNMANPVLNMELGMNPILVGLAVAIPRLWDAFTDPLMGVISDRTRTRWGRRRPFILVGGFFSMILMTLIWQIPTGASQGMIFGLFLAMSLMFYTAYTVFGVPYQSLGFELSTGYNERTRVMAWRYFFGSFSGILMQWTFWLTQRSVFHDTVHGMKWVGFGIGVSVFLTALIPAIFVKERVPREAEPKAGIGLVASVREAFALRPFRMLMATQLVVLVGFLLVAFLGSYIAVYHIYGGEMKPASALMGAMGTVYHFSTMAGIPLVTWISTKIGKKNTLIMGFGIACVGTILSWWCFNRGAPYWALMVPLFQAPGLAATWTMSASMVADICDLDELKSRARREGLFGACQGWIMKLGFTIPMVFTGFILVGTGFDADLGGGQSEQTIFLMRVLFALIPLVSFIAGMFLIWRYPIDAEKAHATREELDRRRGPLYS